jgi:ribosome-associated heat shock protein Hsp15
VTPPCAGQVRLDKWLWAARFFKTRALAAEAIANGRVAVNGRRAKASKSVATGDSISIEKEKIAWSVVVRVVSARRGPAREAVELYEETPESREARERAARERAEQAHVAPIAGRTGGRPSKRDRRRMERLRGLRDPFGY